MPNRRKAKKASFGFMGKFTIQQKLEFYLRAVCLEKFFAFFLFFKAIYRLVIFNIAISLIMNLTYFQRTLGEKKIRFPGIVPVSFWLLL